MKNPGLDLPLLQTNYVCQTCLVLSNFNWSLHWVYEKAIVQEKYVIYCYLLNIYSIYLFIYLPISYMLVS